FSLGAHPAFNIPFYNHENYTDYYLHFDQDQYLIVHELNEEGYFNGKQKPLNLAEGVLMLSKDLFKEGAMVFKELKSRNVILRNRNSPEFISVSFPHFESLGLWSAPGADFICIEPWLGYADNAGPAVEFSERPGVRSL